MTFGLVLSPSSGGGSPGPAGADGKNAFCRTLEFNWGNPNEPVNVPIDPANGGQIDWAGVDQPIFVSDGAHSGLLYFVEVGPLDPEFGYQTATLFDRGTAGNPAVNTTIAAGAKMSPGGEPG